MFKAAKICAITSAYSQITGTVHILQFKIFKVLFKLQVSPLSSAQLKLEHVKFAAPIELSLILLLLQDTQVPKHSALN